MYSEEGGSEKTFGHLDGEGKAAKLLVLGKYYYRIISENYHPSEGVVTLTEPDGKHIEPVTLRPNFANITLLVDNEADIYINKEKKGVGSWNGNLVPGTYSIECRKPNHKSTTETITVIDGKNTTHALKAPTPIVGGLVLNSTPLCSNVLIDGEAAGETPLIKKGLLIGAHTVTVSKEGYETATFDILISENENIEKSIELKKIERPAPVVAKGNAQNSSNSNGAGGNTFTVNGVSFKMIPVKGGTFEMGATSEQQDSYDNEKPVHSVTLSDYYIGETEVTQPLWQAVMGSNPSYFKGDNNPVEKVSYDDCKAFIEKLNTLLANQLPAGRKFRLPTEAEWEYAARGGNQTKCYQYSGSNTLNDVAWYDSNSGSKTHPVKQKQPNKLGIYDMSGNVYEWCSDRFAGYSSSAQTNPTGPSSGSFRVLRGGSWCNNALRCRVAVRYSYTPDSRRYNFGLRLVFDGGALEQRSASSAQSGNSTAMLGSKTSAPYKIGDYYNDGTKEGIVFEISNGGYSGKIVSLEQN
ncbi:MAG: SUMF1/EgtB/PvdO family nonheme iron enzyme, partial [Bacteroidaceae bacterium]|nr:SUMF1/EgtB/PvdO family nonheme iron enzyme [Bacteroidaceae bacterium]